MPAVGHSVRQKVVAVAAVAALLAGGAFAAVSATGEGNGHPRHAHASVHRLRPRDLDAAAAYLGLSPQQLAAELDSSKSLAQVASARSGKSEQGLIDAIVAARRARLVKTSANLPKRISAEVNRSATTTARHGAASPRAHRKRTALSTLDRFTASGHLGATAAHYLGITPARLRDQLHSGKTLAQIASATPSKSTAGLLSALVAAKTKRLARALPADAASQARLARKTKRVRKRMHALLARKFAGTASLG